MIDPEVSRGLAILIAPEILGDANADGKVDLTDLSTILNHFGQQTPNWTDGNFDGAATIDLTDLSNVLNNFGVSNPNPRDAASFGGASIATSSSQPVRRSNVPGQRMNGVVNAPPSLWVNSRPLLNRPRVAPHTSCPR